VRVTLGLHAGNCSASDDSKPHKNGVSIMYRKIILALILATAATAAIGTSSAHAIFIDGVGGCVPIAGVVVC
jgi:hypothetical protein